MVCYSFPLSFNMEHFKDNRQILFVLFVVLKMTPLHWGVKITMFNIRIYPSKSAKAINISTRFLLACVRMWMIQIHTLFTRVSLISTTLWKFGWLAGTMLENCGFLKRRLFSSQDAVPARDIRGRVPETFTRNKIMESHLFVLFFLQIITSQHICYHMPPTKANPHVCNHMPTTTAYW